MVYCCRFSFFFFVCFWFTSKARTIKLLKVLATNEAYTHEHTHTHTENFAHALSHVSLMISTRSRMQQTNGTAQTQHEHYDSETLRRRRRREEKIEMLHLTLSIIKFMGAKEQSIQIWPTIFSVDMILDDRDFDEFRFESVVLVPKCIDLFRSFLCICGSHERLFSLL